MNSIMCPSGWECSVLLSSEWLWYLNVYVASRLVWRWCYGCRTRILAGNNYLKSVLNLLMDLLFINMQLFSSKDVNWWTGGLLVDYCDVFISCLHSHSDGTHSLQSIHWWVSDVMLHFSKSVLMKKQTHLHLGWPEDEYISANLHFWVNYSFKAKAESSQHSAFVCLRNSYLVLRAQRSCFWISGWGWCWTLFLEAGALWRKGKE